MNENVKREALNKLENFEQNIMTFKILIFFLNEFFLKSEKS